jgi:hypothetical protein
MELRCSSSLHRVLLAVPSPLICTCRVTTCASRTKGASPYQHHNPEYQGMRNGRRRRRLNPFLPYTFHICCCLIPRCLAAARPSLPSFLLSFRRTLPEGFHRTHPRPWNIGWKPSSIRKEKKRETTALIRSNGRLHKTLKFPYLVICLEYAP